MPISEIDINLTKSLVGEIDTVVSTIERKVKVCDVRGIISDFESSSKFLKETGPMISDMRVAEPENKEMLGIAKNFASIYNRNLDARHTFENKCVCSHKKT